MFYQMKKMKAKTNFFKILLLAVLTATVIESKAQELQSTDSLYKEIAHMDSLLFNAFNSHDTTTFNSFFSHDLEFFHDKGGLTGYRHTTMFAKAQAENKTDLKRTLIRGTLEVYPIKDYGAIQIGPHKFCHTENGKPDCGTFKFIHVWKKTNDKWQITRVLSYDH